MRHFHTGRHEFTRFSPSDRQNQPLCRFSLFPLRLNPGRACFHELLPAQALHQALELGAFGRLRREPRDDKIVSELRQTRQRDNYKSRGKLFLQIFRQEPAVATLAHRVDHLGPGAAFDGHIQPDPRR